MLSAYRDSPGVYSVIAWQAKGWLAWAVGVLAGTHSATGEYLQRFTFTLVGAGGRPWAAQVHIVAVSSACQQR